MGTLSPLLLAIDSSTRTVGLALYDGFQVIHESTWTSNEYHTVELAPAVNEALHRADLSVEAIGALAVALGPGSFTGLRIGMALAKGMALVRHLPLIGVPTLDIIACAQPIHDVLMAAVLRAGRGRLAVGWYRALNSGWEPTQMIGVFTPQELADQIKQPTYLCGELDEADRELIRQANPLVTLASPAWSLRRPAFLAELGWKRWKAGQIDEPATLSPIYLHYNEPIPG
jgi:tRNA threonylcarbamoyladenosine biosynthesis protein TsaB